MRPDSNGKKRLQGPRCSATTKAGERCRALASAASGLCAAHSGQDMAELGRLSAKARSQPNPARVHPGLREYLRAEVHPERVWAALEAAMLGSNESARVAASKVLLDALAEPARGCPVCEAREQEAPDIEKRLLELLARH